MDPFFILAIIISTLVFIILPLLFIGLVFYILKKKTNKKVAITISAILLTSLGYFITTNFYPTDTFYIDNFEDNTGLTLPKSKSRICSSGNNSFYSFGDYNISYSYKFSTKDYDNLYSQLMTNGLQTAEKYLETDENEKILRLDNSIKIKKMLTKDFGFKNFDVLFMDDNKTIIFNSNKW